MAHERHVFDATGGRPNRRLIEAARRNPGAAKKSVQIVYEKQNSCYTGPLAESELCGLQQAAAWQKERTGKSPLRRFAHNPKRELRQGGKFFTPNGRNPLKCPDSKK
jgi:hypothetical protein